jgi:hypothetical protein
MGAVLQLVTVIVAKLPEWIAAGEEVYEIIERTQAVIDENKVVGDPEWDALDASVRQHKAEFDAAAKD